MEHKIFSALALATLLLCSCQDSRVVGKVGNFTVTGRDVRLRNEVIRVYNAQEQRDLGFQQLQTAFTYAQILENNGAPITTRDLEAEANRINAKSLMPEVLDKIKNIFKKDKEAYHRLFILPILAERKIYFDYFLKASSVQKEALEKAEKFAKDASKNPSVFKNAGKDKDLKALQFSYSRKNGVQWKVEKPRQEKRDLAHNIPGEGLAQEVMESMRKKLEKDRVRSEEAWVATIRRTAKKVGQVTPVIDRGDKFLVARLVKVHKGLEEYEAVFLPKADYAAWLKSEKEKVSVVSTDR